MTNTTVKYSHYEIKVDFVESPQHPITYLRKCRKCTTQNGMKRQHDRMVSEACKSWRDYGFQLLTVSRIPSIDDLPTNGL